MSELKRCPHCGGEASHSIGRLGDGSPWHYVECEACGATAVSPAKWNYRAPVEVTGPYSWLFHAPWEEVAAILFSYDAGDDPDGWIAEKHAEWPKMFRDALNGIHHGDCVKQPISCSVCHAQEMKGVIDRMRAALAAALGRVGV